MALASMSRLAGIFVLHRLTCSKFAILGSILAVQLLMGVSAAIYANQVFCKDDSFLSTARLLRRKFCWIVAEIN